MSKTCFCGTDKPCGYQIETDMEQHDKIIYEQGYNKAIDEFAERLKNHLNEFDFWKYGITDGKNYQSRNYDYMIDEIAEELRGAE